MKSMQGREGRWHVAREHAGTVSALTLRICFAFRENLSRHVVQSKKSVSRTKQSIGSFFLDTQNGLFRPPAKPCSETVFAPILRNGLRADTINQGWLLAPVPQKHSNLLTTHKFQGTLVR